MIETLSPESLSTVAGGFSRSDMPAGAQQVLDWQAAHPVDAKLTTASGPFALPLARRKEYMGANYKSTDLEDQYRAATKYVGERYGGSWDKAAATLQSRGYY